MAFRRNKKWRLEEIKKQIWHYLARHNTILVVTTGENGAYTEYGDLRRAVPVDDVGLTSSVLLWRHATKQSDSPAYWLLACRVLLLPAENTRTQVHQPCHLQYEYTGRAYGHAGWTQALWHYTYVVY